jgi:acylphosphatase
MSLKPAIHFAFLIFTFALTMKHLDITVKGKVQGVFYRASTKAVADQLGHTRHYEKSAQRRALLLKPKASLPCWKCFWIGVNEGPQDAEITSLKLMRAN